MPYVSSITRSVDAATVEVSKRRRQVRAIWSSDEADAHRTAFVMSGIDTERFSANPVNLWEHGKSAERGTMPVANAIEYGADRFKGKNVFIGTSRFWDDEFSDRLFDRYAAGHLRGWSINVLPLEASPPTREERRARPDWADLDMVYRSTRLLEVSATSVPSNPSTLTLAVERGLGGARAKALGLAMGGGDRVFLDDAYRKLKYAHRRSVGCWAIAPRRGGIVKLPGMESLSIEELEQEIKRLKLMKELCELMAKHEEALKWKAEADRIEKEKAAMAGGRG